MLPYFIVLPIFNVRSHDVESAYLKTTDRLDFSDILSQTKILENEDATLYYDSSKLNDFVKFMQANDESYPSQEQLINKLNDWEEISSSYEKSLIFPSNIEISKGIACAYYNNDTTNKVLVDTGNFIKRGKLPVKTKVINCTDSELFTWLANNRMPKRIYDTNYNKHSKTEKASSKGVISPIEYKNEEVQEFLQWAVGNEKGRMFLHDLIKGKIIVFWYENVDHLYHAYNVNEDDSKEKNKILKQGKKQLYEKIERVAHIIIEMSNNKKGVK